MRTGIAHLLLAAALAATALLARGPWLLALYPALSLSIVAAAYLLGRPGLLGKGLAGRRSPAMSALLLPYVLALRLVLYLEALPGGAPPWTEVAEGLCLGGMARFDAMPPGVDLVVDLSAELAADPRVVAGRTYVNLPALDGLPADPAALRELADRIAAWPGRALIHGTRGRGRSAALMAAVMVRRGLAPDLDAALARIAALRPGVAPSADQRRASEAALLTG